MGPQWSGGQTRAMDANNKRRLSTDGSSEATHASIRMTNAVGLVKSSRRFPTAAVALLSMMEEIPRRAAAAYARWTVSVGGVCCWVRYDVTPININTTPPTDILFCSAAMKDTPQRRLARRSFHWMSARLATHVKPDPALAVANILSHEK